MLARPMIFGRKRPKIRPKKFFPKKRPPQEHIPMTGSFPGLPPVKEAVKVTVKL
jgi:hypothetical protein